MRSCNKNCNQKIICFIHKYNYAIDLINYLFFFTSWVDTEERIGAAGVANLVVTTGCRLTVAYCAESIKLIHDWLTSSWCCCGCCCCCCWGCCCCCCVCCCCLLFTDAISFDTTELLAEAAFDSCVICDCGELRNETDIEDVLEPSPRCRTLEATVTDLDVLDDLFDHCVNGVWQDAIICIWKNMNRI